MELYYEQEQGSYSPVGLRFHINELLDTFDPDDDNVYGSDDNCPDEFNPNQYDSDLDGIGDLCDDCTFNESYIGNVNQDSDINVLDVMLCVNIILNGGFNSILHSECEILYSDIDNNSIINITDVIQIINIIFDN
tara:strand:+ start:420 stop:824 length:405 start_codon:yes stop_codon:yes gene_type:complete